MLKAAVFYFLKFNLEPKLSSFEENVFCFEGKYEVNANHRDREKISNNLFKIYISVYLFTMF